MSPQDYEATVNAAPGSLPGAGETSDAPGIANGSGPATRAGLVPGLLDGLRERWRRGDRVAVEAYLREQAATVDDETFLDLVYTEFVLREELGESPQTAEYVRRFPQYTTRLERLFAVDRALLAAPLSGQTRPQKEEKDPAPGHPEAVGKYRIVATLGRGGQGHVYRAVHPTLGQDVVIKLSRQGFIPDPAQRDHLLAEGRVLADLNHPNLARVYDLDFHEDQVYLVLEYVRGRTLDQYARQERPSPRTAAALLAPLAAALAAAHRRGIIHRDVKPGNILIDEAGKPRLIDFGLARLENAWSEDLEIPGTVSGTMQFMAPEQARGETDRVGPRSDTFALGAVLYFLLTGRPPFDGSSLSEVLGKARDCAFDRSALRARGVPRRLAAICLRAMAADPADRYARADDLQADLEAFARRSPVLLAVAAAAAFLLVAGVALGWSNGWWLAPATVEKAPPLRPDDREDGKPSLFVRVWDQGRYLNLVPPLRTGDEVQVRAEVPAELHASLFLFTSEGKLRLLTQRGPETAAAPLRYTAKVIGPAGTEFVLVCGRRSGPIGVAEVEGAWDKLERWPALPADSLLRLQRGRVSIEQKGRDFGAARQRADPEGDVQDRLERLRGRLRERFEHVEGLAFPHQR